MGHKKTVLCTACLLVLLVPGWGWAQSGAEPSFSLGEVVVTEKRPGVEDISINHEMSQKEIQATGSKTLAEALRFAPGIVVTTGAKNEPEISIHGFGTEKSLFLIDGIPYYETYYGKLNLDQIPSEIISKIEITKNAPSVLYGANTQIAVVNVVTKKGTDYPSFNVTQEVGENDTFRTAVSHGNQIGNMNYWLSYSRRQTDGWRLSDDYEVEEADPARPFMGGPLVTEDGGFRENADLIQDSLWGRIGLNPDEDAQYFLSAYMVQAEKGMPFNTDEYRVFTTQGDDAGFSNFSRFQNYDDWGLDFSARQEVLPWLTLRGKLFYHDHSDDYVSYADPDLEDKIARSTYDDSYYGGSAFVDVNAVPWHTGHLSFHYKKDTHEDRAGSDLPFNEFQSYTGSVGTEHEFFTDWGLTAVAGVSYDWFEVTDAEETVFDDNDLFDGQTDLEGADPDGEFNPMLGLSWELPDTTRMYGSVAKKTRFPTLSQLYSGRSGNPDLTSEQSINYTLGTERSFAGLVHLRVEGFYHDISDWISRDYYEDDFTGEEIYTNVEDVEMLGAELGVELTPVQNLSLGLDYTYNDAENTSDKAVTDKVAGVAENQLVLRMSALIPWIQAQLDLRGIYVDEIYEELPTTADPDTEITSSDDHFTLNGRLSKDLGEHFSAYLEAENLFDRDYESEIGFPGPGRNVLVGIKARF